MATDASTVERRPSPHRGPLESAIASALSILATLFGLFILAYVVLFVTKGRFLKDPFVNFTSRYTERTVRVGGDFQLYLNPHIKFLAEDIAIANPPWARDDQLFEARLVDLKMNVWRLIFGQQRFNFLRLDRADIALERDGKGSNTWTFAKKSDEPFELPIIKRAGITGTTVSYIDPAMDFEVGLKIGDVTARTSEVQGPITLSGKGSSKDVPFTVRGQLSSPNETIAGGRNQLALNIAVGDSTIDVAGTLPGATELEGSDLRVTARGANLATPFTLMGVVIPETRRYRVAGNLTKAGNEWRFTRLNGVFGDSDLAGRMTVDTGRDRLYLTADLSSRKLDILDVGPWVGYSPERLDAQGGKGAITREGGRPRVLPDAPLASESLGRFDAKVKYRARTVDTGNVPYSNAVLDLTLDRKRLALQPVAFDLAGGRLTSDIIINARQTPVVTDYDIRMSAVRLNALLTSFDFEGSGTTGTVRGRVQLRGFGDTVRESLGSSNGRIAVIFPRGTLWIRNAELAELDIGDFIEAALSKDLKKPADIRCGLLGFTVRNGVAAADPIFIDTEKAVIRGRGAFSFSQESLDLAMEADAKNFSLFSGQSPIGIQGYFAEPRIDPISKELLTRAGVSLAAAAVVSPIAVVLGFIDLGEEEDTNCAPILAGARTAAVRAADKAAEKDDDRRDRIEEAREEQRERAERRARNGRNAPRMRAKRRRKRQRRRVRPPKSGRADRHRRQPVTPQGSTTRVYRCQVA